MEHLLLLQEADVRWIVCPNAEYEIEFVNYMYFWLSFYELYTSNDSMHVATLDNFSWLYQTAVERVNYARTYFKYN